MKNIYEKWENFDSEIDHFLVFSLKLENYLIKFVNSLEILNYGGWIVGIRHFTPHSIGKKMIFWLTNFGLKALSRVAKKF